MKNKIKGIVKVLFNTLGLSLNRYPSAELDRRRILLNRFGIDLVLDVGANMGQYAQELRRLGYKGKIISFEPIPEVFEKLTSNMAEDASWMGHNYAFGNVEETKEINVSRNFASSSILPINKSTTDIEPKTTYYKKEKIKIKTLSSEFSALSNGHRNILLKLDVQGFEYNVLRGAKSCLSNCTLLQLEMSLFELYEGEKLFDEMLAYLNENNFKLCSLEPGFYDKSSGNLLQVDGIFVNKNRLS